MNSTNKENQFTYFKFFFRILGFKMVLVVLLNIFIGLLDGIGITMLFPLLQSIDGSNNIKESMGQFRYIITFFENLGFPLTANIILLIFLCLFIIKGIVKYLSSLYQLKIQHSYLKKYNLIF
jgi:subfamily B ATP-binding cassette protein MsbA